MSPSSRPQTRVVAPCSGDPVRSASERGLEGEVPSFTFLGVRVDGLTTESLYRAIAEAIESGSRIVIGNHNLHSIYLYHRDAKMRRFYARARYVFIDGMPLIWVGRLLGYPLRREHRMTSIDWLRPMLPTAVTRGWRVFLLGSRPGVAERTAAMLRSEFPGLEIDAMHGFFDLRAGSVEGELVLNRIRAYRPHLLCLGLGMPRQEHWIEDHIDRLESGVILNLGGFMDLLTGELPLPPRWISRLGLEWLVRLASRPGRVWRRYLVEPWFLLPLLARDLRARRRAGS
jgi:N-acetylglucosaminyldiphosphoundecaprenol N-acetyl-beta-D-mannosaminyltransferase